MREDYFKDIYNDFFGIESSPSLKVKKEEDVKVRSQEEMTSLFLKINDLYISDESKDLLKKMIEYMRKFHEKTETNYVPFRLIIKSNTDSLIEEINDILYILARILFFVNNVCKILIYSFVKRFFRLSVLPYKTPKNAHRSALFAILMIFLYRF